MKIRTDKQAPYITRNGWVTEWHAWDEDSYDGAEDSNSPVGCGDSELAAVNDLVEQMMEPLEHRLQVFIDTDWEMKKTIMILQAENTRLRSTSTQNTPETDALQPRGDLQNPGEGQDSGQLVRGHGEATGQVLTPDAYNGRPNDYLIVQPDGCLDEERELGLQGRVDDYDYHPSDYNGPRPNWEERQGQE